MFNTIQKHPLCMHVYYNYIHLQSVFSVKSQEVEMYIAMCLQKVGKKDEAVSSEKSPVDFADQLLQMPGLTGSAKGLAPVKEPRAQGELKG